MAKKKQKYYVVWRGRNIGIFNSWEDCQQQVNGIAGARYKSFDTLREAEFAFKNEAQARASAVAKREKTERYYVVWRGHEPGIYDDWNQARAQINGFTGAQYQTFGSKTLADKAWSEGPEAFKGRDFRKVSDITTADLERVGRPIPLSIAVDAACNGRTGQFEYRGVITETGTQVFHAGPFADGSNNVGEFLAIVHGLAYLKKIGSDMPIYSDSRNAIAWVKARKSRSWVKNANTQDLMQRAEKWLAANAYSNPLLKWETKYWGEVPADFGRK